MTQTYLTDLENTLLIHDFISRSQFEETPEVPYLYGKDGLPFTDNEIILLSAEDSYHHYVLREMSCLHRVLRKQQFAIGIFMLFCTTSLLSLFCMLSATSMRRSETNELEMANDMEERETMGDGMRHREEDRKGTSAFTCKSKSNNTSTNGSVIPLTAKKTAT